MLLPLDGGVENPRCLGAATACERPFWLGADPIVEAQIDSVRVIDPDREPMFLSNRPAIAVPSLAPAQSALAKEPAAAAGSAISSCSKVAARNRSISQIKPTDLPLVNSFCRIFQAIFPQMREID